MDIKITNISCDWKSIKNKCRVTDNKLPTEANASDAFVKKLLISEHSPIRQARIEWLWEGIKSWVSVHFARHWLGWDKWVSTQRTDRTGVDRDKSTQDTPVNMAVEANAQALINVARYRLCIGQASKETREYMEGLKAAIYADAQEPEVSDVMVPNCIYRCGCPEFTECGFFKTFCAEMEKRPDKSITNIQDRYDVYNDMFWRNRNVGSD